MNSPKSNEPLYFHLFDRFLLRGVLSLVLTFSLSFAAPEPVQAQVVSPWPEFDTLVLNKSTEVIILPGFKAPEPPKPPPPAPKRVVAQKKPLTLPSSGTAYGTAIPLYRDNTNNCVAWVKKKTGINRPLGNGARGAIQGKEPRIGAIGSVTGSVHAVLVVGINGNQITVHESNYVRNWIVQRTLPLSMFIGFIYS